MKMHSDKNEKIDADHQERRSAANQSSVLQRKEAIKMLFTDNRPEAREQRNLKGMVENHSRVMQARVIQREVFNGDDVDADVRAFARNPNEKWQAYQIRFKAHYSGPPRNYKNAKNWGENKAKVQEKFNEIYLGAVAEQAVVEETVRSEVNKPMLQLEFMGPSEKTAAASGHIAQYVSTGKTVSFAGKTVNVFDIGGGQWGYLDLQHGEIEVITADQTSGTTLGFKTILFDYDVIKKTIRGEVSHIIRITNTHEAALIAGKTHAYNLK